MPQCSVEHESGTNGGGNRRDGSGGSGARRVRNRRQPWLRATRTPQWGPDCGAAEEAGTRVGGEAGSRRQGVLLQQGAPAV